MRDDELRVLERTVRESPDDPAAWVRYVRALDLAGGEPPKDLEEPFMRVTRVRECLRSDPTGVPWAGIVDPGDEVLVVEHDAPKILGPWRGRVLWVDWVPGPARFRVRPLALDDDTPEIAWRTSPRPEWLRDGLVVSPPIDRIELIARGPSTPGPPAR